MALVLGWNSNEEEASYVCASAGAGRCAPADSTPNTSARSPLPHLPQLASASSLPSPTMRAALTLLIALQLVAVADSASVSDLPANIRSMRTKQLMQILEDRGVTCKHCSESKLPSQRTQQTRMPPCAAVHTLHDARSCVPTHTHMPESARSQGTASFAWVSALAFQCVDLRAWAGLQCSASARRVPVLGPRQRLDRCRPSAF